jgi:hypothetical protein
MRKAFRSINRSLTSFGISIPTFLQSLAGRRLYRRDKKLFITQMQSSPQEFPLGSAYPHYTDRFMTSGSIDSHYVNQDLLVAQKILRAAPALHVDVGSRIDGFVTHVATFRPIEVIDIRPLPYTITNVRFLQTDFMQPLPAALQNYCDSLSCLHALEHFGLGRYGDPVNAQGYQAGLDNLRTMLKPAGRLYLSVPIGPQRVEFNAHRVFSVAFLLSHCAPHFQLASFSYIDDGGSLHTDVALDERAIATNFGCRYGCGIFEFVKNP